jgi:hypothetical protein
MVDTVKKLPEGQVFQSWLEFDHDMGLLSLLRFQLAQGCRAEDVSWRPCACSNNNNFQLWQPDNHPIELTTPVIAHQKLDYLHYNPVVAGIVEKPEDYLYSSAIDYYTNRKGKIAIERIDPILKAP